MQITTDLEKKKSRLQVCFKDLLLWDQKLDHGYIITYSSAQCNMNYKEKIFHWMEFLKVYLHYIHYRVCTHSISPQG